VPCVWLSEGAGVPLLTRQCTLLTLLKSSLPVDRIGLARNTVERVRPLAVERQPIRTHVSPRAAKAALTHETPAFGAPPTTAHPPAHPVATCRAAARRVE
jgi:hypothetical protein